MRSPTSVKQAILRKFLSKERSGFSLFHSFDRRQSPPQVQGCAAYVAQLTAKKLVDLQKVAPCPSLQCLAAALLSLCGRLDVGSSKLPQTAHWESFLKFVAKPGSTLQELRKLASSLTNEEVGAAQVRLATTWFRQCKYEEIKHNETAIHFYMFLHTGLGPVTRQKKSQVKRTKVPFTEPSEISKKKAGFTEEKTANTEKHSHDENLPTEESIHVQAMQLTPETLNIRRRKAPVPPHTNKTLEIRRIDHEVQVERKKLQSVQQAFQRVLSR